MNGLEQRLHRTATATLAERLDNLETVVEALAQRQIDAVTLFKAGLRHEGDSRIAQAREIRGYIDRGDQTQRDHFECLYLRTFWQRFTWLVTGR